MHYPMPKSTNTYTQIASWENLYLAYRNAARGKRSRASAALFEFKLEDNLIQLHHELRDQSYRPGPYVNFTIHEPKRRLISAAPFRDRVVHHALCQVIEPAFERSFIEHSYANRQEKGTHRAVDQCQQWMQQYAYMLPLDMRQFFPSIDHEILRNTLWRKVQDGQTRALINHILASGVGVLSTEYDMVYFPGDNLLAATRPRGLPIGNLTSQFWANCAMHPFDLFVTRQLGCGAYLRYVDDLLLFGNNKEELWAWKEAIAERLAQMRLTIHEQSAEVKPTSHGVRFLGFVIYPEYRLLLRRKGINYQRKLKQMLLDYRTQKRDRASVQASIQGWINHVRYANTWGLRRAMLRNVRLSAQRPATPAQSASPSSPPAPPQYLAGS